MIVVATSSLNQCQYCVIAHGAILRIRAEDPLIADQIAGDLDLNPDPTEGSVVAPWLLWGPYLWADGTTPRSDGLRWNREDLETDGVHPAESGEAKVAALLGDFFGHEPGRALHHLPQIARPQ